MGKNTAKKSEDEERLIPPCFLPPSPDDSNVNQQNIWTVDPSKAPPDPEEYDHDVFPSETHDTYFINGVRYIFPKRQHINVHTKEWIGKYNALLTKCKEFESKYLFEKKKFGLLFQTWTNFSKNIFSTDFISCFE